MGQYMFDVLNFSLADTIRHNQKDRSRDLLRIDLVAFELPLDSSQKLAPVPFPLRLPGRIPALEIEPSDQHRQLGRKLSRLLNRQPVAQRMQRSPQSGIGLLPVSPTQYLH